MSEGVHADAAVLTALISALARGRDGGGALKVYRRRLRQIPPALTEMEAIGEGGAFAVARAAHEVLPDARAVGAVRARSFELGYLVDEVGACLNCALIACQHGRWTREALTLLGESARRGVIPDTFGLTAAILACRGADGGLDGRLDGELGAQRGGELADGRDIASSGEVDLALASAPSTRREELAFCLFEWGVALGIQPDSMCFDALARVSPDCYARAVDLIDSVGVLPVRHTAARRFGSGASAAKDDDAAVTAAAQLSCATLSATMRGGSGACATPQPPTAPRLADGQSNRGDGPRDEFDEPGTSVEPSASATAETLRLVGLLGQLGPYLRLFAPMLVPAPCRAPPSPPPAGPA
jgi:hypothetical protein